MKSEYNSLYRAFGRKGSSGDEESLSTEPEKPAEEKTLDSGPIVGRRKLYLRGAAPPLGSASKSPEAPTKPLETSTAADASDAPDRTEEVDATSAPLASGPAAACTLMEGDPIENSSTANA